MNTIAWDCRAFGYAKTLHNNVLHTERRSRPCFEIKVFRRRPVNTAVRPTSLVVFSKNRLEHIQTTQINEYFLEKTGLPQFCAPHLYFGNFENEQELPELNLWNWAEKEYHFSKSVPYVLGSSPSEDPICIFSNQPEVVVINPIKLNSFTFMNSNVPLLAQTIHEVESVIDVEVNKNENVVINGEMQPSSLSPVYAFLKKHDPMALLEGSFWLTELAYLARKA